MSDYENNPFEGRFDPAKDAELRALHEELSSIRFSERESFGPELEAELRKEWQAEPPQRSPFKVRRVIAASLAGLLSVGVFVPNARAGLVRFLVAVQDGAEEVLGLPDAPDAAEAPALELTREELPVVPLPVLLEPPSGVAESQGDLRLAGVSFPILKERGAVARLAEQYYPRWLQIDGVGGTVRLLLWVNGLGRVGDAEISSTSGYAELDHAAIIAAGSLRFEPARRRGIPVGTWAELDFIFQATPDVVAEADRPAAVSESAAVASLPEAPISASGASLDLEPGWAPEALELRSLVSAETMLREALEADGRDSGRWDGDLTHLVSGEAPTGTVPLEWRAEAVSDLEGAIVGDPTNPAPFLALGRIRKTQGLKLDARRLFERGIDRATGQNGVVPKRVVADLHYERAILLQEQWLGWRDLGRMPTVALGAGTCTGAPVRASHGTYAPAQTLIAWNYLCPEEFDRLMRSRLEPLEHLKNDALSDLLVSLYTAVEVFPGHVEAGRELLLSLADDRLWGEMLERVASALRYTGSHPDMELLAGLALQRLGRPEQAMGHFNRALAGLPRDQQVSLRDVRVLLEPHEVRSFPSPGTLAWEDAIARFWYPLDPVLSTAVNEREVEHLARTAYAHLRFGSANSDAGRVWVRYGRPNQSWSVEEGGSMRAVFWDYGPGPNLTFRRPANSYRMDLTAEGAAYLEDLAAIFPHGYEPSAEEIQPLPVQFARFRAPDGPGLEIEVHTEVPASLATGAGDRLTLGVFMVGPDGWRQTVERRELPAVVAPIHLALPVHPRASQLVVELHHADRARSAAFRIPVSAERSENADLGLSDLMLLDPAAVFHEGAVSRSASWLTPRVHPGEIAVEEVGVFFEIYGLTPGDARYRLSAVLEDLATGVRSALDLKPAGELEFIPVWDRVRRQLGGLAEYMTVDLSGATAGFYLIRVKIETEAGTVESTRALEVG